MHYQRLGRRQRVTQTATGRSSTPNYRYPSERWLLLITLLIIGAARTSPDRAPRPLALGL